MIGRKFLHLLRDESGSMAIEFALLVPALVAMLLGVFQIGMTMHSYNAMRSAAADIARYTVVQYQGGNFRTETDLTTTARAVATAAPYSLNSARLSKAEVKRSDNQRVAGTTEMTVTLVYSSPSVMNLIGVGDIPLRFSQPVFLVE